MPMTCCECGCSFTPTEYNAYWHLGFSEPFLIIACNACMACWRDSIEQIYIGVSVAASRTRALFGKHGIEVAE